MATEQRQLARLQWRVTTLCVLRAGLRGRYHLVRPPQAYRYPGAKWEAEQYRARVMERLAP
jgi:hypothetical protein